MKMSAKEAEAIIKSLKFRDRFVTAVTRDYRTKDVLMVASMNKQAVLKTLTTGRMHYWSVSRRRLWLKGEISKHYQFVRDVHVDCDGDALVFDVEQVGAACHEGYRSCFYRKIKRGKLEEFRKKSFKPRDIYRKGRA